MPVHREKARRADWRAALCRLKARRATVALALAARAKPPTRTFSRAGLSVAKKAKDKRGAEFGYRSTVDYGDRSKLTWAKPRTKTCFLWPPLIGCLAWLQQRLGRAPCLNKYNLSPSIRSSNCHCSVRPVFVHYFAAVLLQPSLVSVRQGGRQKGEGDRREKSRSR